MVNNQNKNRRKLRPMVSSFNRSSKLMMKMKPMLVKILARMILIKMYRQKMCYHHPLNLPWVSQWWVIIVVKSIHTWIWSATTLIKPKIIVSPNLIIVLVTTRLGSNNWRRWKNWKTSHLLREWFIFWEIDHLFWLCCR